MNKTQKMKSNFRNSKIWKAFRHQKNVEQKGIDPITKSKLRKGCNCHHKKLTSEEEEYSDISNPENYVMVNSSTHQTIHWLYGYYKKDPEILDRLKSLLDEMVEINGGK